MRWPSAYGWYMYSLGICVGLFIGWRTWGRPLKNLDRRIKRLEEES